MPEYPKIHDCTVSPRQIELHVEPARIEVEGESSLITIPLSWGDRRFDAWFRVTGAKVASSGAVAAAMSLVPAMRLARKLRIDEPLDSRLLAALPRIQEIVSVWNPAVAPLEVEAPASGGGGTQASRGIGAFFSGGVDSYYTVLRHREEITHLIHVRQGFDIALRKKALADQVTERMREAAKELGKPLIEITSNVREFSDPLVNWGTEYHGSALAAVSHLLQGTLRKAYIASTHSYADLFPWGSHPLLDPLWSTESMEIVHDGCEATRVRKVAAIAMNPTAMRTLRVCYSNKKGAYNCGRCEKCLRTMINLTVAGVMEECATFERPLRLRDIRLIRVNDANTASFVAENLRAAEAQGTQTAFAEALRAALHRRYYRGWGHIARVAYRTLDRLENLQSRLRGVKQGKPVEPH